MIHTLDLAFQDCMGAIAAFLMETDEGPVLFETGPDSCFPVLKKKIKSLGYNLDDIRHVFLTHIHFDHAGAAWKFAQTGSKVYVHPAGFPHLCQPEKLWGSAVRIYGQAMESLWGRMEPIASDSLVSLSHGEVCTIGGKQITGWHTPGHAVHHVAYQVDSVLFTGDVAGVCMGNGPVIPPCPPPDIHIENWLESIDLLRKLGAETLYLTHFGRLSRAIGAHLDHLEEKLLNYASWMHENMLLVRDLPQIIDSFEEMSSKELKTLAPEDFLRYQFANPGFMSVNGLIRYWTKVKGLTWP